MPIELAHLEAIFSEALAKSTPADRADFLDQACGSNLELRHRIERLLVAHETAQSFMAPPDPDRTFEPVAAVREKSGSKIGRYKLLEQIGEGGFGVVFMAEQEQPVRRRVALKIIKLGMDTKQVVARFEAERQALAMMDHPNIAKVLDAGATELGRPFFVMELVKGRPITDFCDAHRLPPVQRVELFITVCQAIQHAHQKGIIHRDIKPSNVLVSQHDDRPVVKVIDFGIAKAMDARLTERTLFTEMRHMIGTPAYMSPEQAGVSDLDVDTRSDVYSLGVLLYELLTGSPPFHPKELCAKAFAEIQRIIRDSDPPKPSTKLLTMKDDLPTVAANRQLEPAKLAQIVRGDLDWIVMRCLEKDRARRYETANGLAIDLWRYLNDEPVQARPATRAYRLRKFIRRNKASVISLAGMVALLLAGAAATTWQAIRATRAQRDTSAALERVQAEKRQTDAANASLSAVNEFLTHDVLGAANPKVMRGRQMTVLEALDNAALSISGRFTDDPSTQVAIRMALADAYRSLGRPELAMPHAQAAIALCEKNFASDDRHTLEASLEMGELRLVQDKLTEAEPVIERTLATCRRSLGDDDELTIQVVGCLARLRFAQGKLPDAESLARQAVAGRQAELGPLNWLTLKSQDLLATVLSARGKLSEAEAIIRGITQADRQQLGEDHPETMHSMCVLANLLQTDGHYAESEQLYRSIVANASRVYPADHLWRLTYLGDFAELLQKEGKLDEAETIFREALDKSRRALGADHDTTLGIENNLARVLTARRQFEEAEPMYREVVDQGLKKRGWTHPNVLISVMNYERFLRDRGRFDQAEPLAQRALRSARENLGNDHRVTMALMQDMGQILYHVGRADESEKLLRESLDRRRRVLGNENPDTCGALSALGQFLIDMGRYQDAELICGELYKLSAASSMAHRFAASHMSQWGICLARLGKYEQAEAPLLDAYQRLEQSGMRRSDAMLSVISCLAEVYEHTKRSEEAQKRQTEFLALQATTRQSSQPAHIATTRNSSSTRPAGQ